MSALDELRALLSQGGVKRCGPVDDDHQVLLKGHREFLATQQAEELEVQGRAFEPLLRNGEDHGGERLGEAVLSTLSSVRHRGARVASSLPIDDDCQLLEPPAFFIESAAEDVRNDSGKVIRFARANADAKTLEIAAATGEFGGVRWPSSEQFIFGLNRATASLGGVLDIPPHGPGAVLTVSVGLSFEYILFGGDTIAADASSLLHTLKGDGGLPFRGTAIGMARAGLSLHGAGSSSGTGLEFASAWVNRDGSDSNDLTVNGRITLSRTVALGQATSLLAIFVDATCFALAEESEEPYESAFTLFECRDKPVTEITGLYVYPAQIRLSRVNARLCELPVLSGADGSKTA